MKLMDKSAVLSIVMFLEMFEVDFWVNVKTVAISWTFCLFFCYFNHSLLSTIKRLYTIFFHGFHYIALLSLLLPKFFCAFLIVYLCRNSWSVKGAKVVVVFRSFSSLLLAWLAYFWAISWRSRKHSVTNLVSSCFLPSHWRMMVEGKTEGGSFLVSFAKVSKLV